MNKPSAYSVVLSNHVFANLLFGLVIVLGILSYLQLPRQQNTSVNFNWIQITTIFPGASASDIEKKITNVIEEGLKTLADVNFVSSNSREGISSILVRFNDIDRYTFDKRIADLRRIIQQKESQLPEDSRKPNIFEVTSANAFPSATIVLSSAYDDDTLHRQGRRIKRELERFKRVDRINTTGLRDPQIRITYNHQSLNNHALTVGQLAQSIRLALQDLAPGDVVKKSNNFLVRLLGVEKTPADIAETPILIPGASLSLGDIAQVYYARSEATSLSRFKDKPAVLFAVMKKENANTLKLVAQLNAYIQAQNPQLKTQGLSLFLSDDQTEITRDSITIMHNNLLVGLLFVLMVTGLFLGWKMALMTTIGIPFTIAGVFVILNINDFTLNTSILVGIVIALGMLVDDAVVVVEAIYFKMRQGMHNMSAIIGGLYEVIAPVTTSVLTTTATFLPLMLMPGIVGKFMFIVPLVVCSALAVSLFEAYWLLPSKIMIIKPNLQQPTQSQRLRYNCLDKLQYYYGKVLIFLLRRRALSLFVLICIFVGALIAPFAGLIKFDFFAFDQRRLFYLNIHMPPGTPVGQTLSKTTQLKQRIEPALPQGQYRSIVNYAGIMFTDKEPYIGKRYGQIQVSLKAKREIKKAGLSPEEVNDVIKPLRAIIKHSTGVEKVNFLTITGGPPARKPISLKLLGSRYAEILSATQALRQHMESMSAIENLSDDAVTGAQSIEITLKYRNLRELNVSSQEILQTISSMIDGILISAVTIDNETVDIRLNSDRVDHQSSTSLIDELLRTQITRPNGQLIALNELIEIHETRSKEIIRHHNFDLAISMKADIDNSQMNVIEANDQIKQYWQSIKHKHPNVEIDFSGQLDDIEESLNSMVALFIMGIGLIYLILGTQFRSYLKPLIALTAVPMAMTGAIIGILITGYALSLYTLYGIVALSGIAVNASIVMIATANRNQRLGMSKIHATFYAAKRRLIPILITTLTTVAGLFSLSAGLGGKSLIWGPVASSIVFGLMISSLLTVLFLPNIYTLGVHPKRQQRGQQN